MTFYFFEYFYLNTSVKTGLCFSFVPRFHPSHEFDSDPLPSNVLRDGPRIQEAAPTVSMATLRSALRGRRPLLKHKELGGLDQHKQPAGTHTHTHLTNIQLDAQKAGSSQGHKLLSAN